MNRIKFLLCLTVFLPVFACAQTHSELTIRNWDFSRDQQQWKQVCVPHDWAISGPFDKKWDLQVVAIEQNGEKEKSEKTGRSGALPWIGEGHYKTKVSLQELPGHAELVFDGAMSEPVVCVNGREAGRWAYGYNAFHIDVTPYLIKGDNEITVDLNNVEESSRWYPGGGLYRPVKLVMTNKVRFGLWDTYVRINSATAKRAGISVSAKVIGLSSLQESAGSNEKGPKGVEVLMSLIDANGVAVAKCSPFKIMKDDVVRNSFVLTNPHLWSPETPYLYKLRLQLVQNGEVIDEQVHSVGVRSISYTAERGFELNGQPRKFKGVCLHHDLGPLGAAVNKAALIRQVKILKDMGCDAIRTSHNMPSTMQMEVYDSLGMMVMAESFDMWIYAKCKNGYSRFFKEWADKDVENLVQNHRNHPSLVMWSIGNEIPEQGSTNGREMAIHLQDICHRLDPSRPVTQGLDRVDNALSTGFAQAMDIPGFNYRLHRYVQGFEKLPQGYLLGSETASTVSSRGVYKFPVEYTNHKTYDDGQCNGYDTECCWWSNLPDDDFMAMDDLPYTIGQFVWTGFDYLGEPTPYDGYWPSRSSYFGICDLAGLPKDRYYLYRSVWNQDERTIHLLPHWTWPGREGEVTPVYCYTDYPSAELFVNGKSQGRISKVGSDKVSFTTVDTQKPAANQERYDRYRLRWNNVCYEPGELKVVVYDEKGNQAGEQILRTAGKPVAMKVDVWTQNGQNTLKADGEDLAYVTISLVDKNGVEVPDADDQLQFMVKGAGKFRAACNGDATSTEVFTEPTMKLFSGKVVATVQAADQAGQLKLTIRDKSRRVKAKTVVIDVK
ncbi:MAG: DUF4982 domain-containing protein [Prevotella sp.]|nr:DUF4982 domain-containing protein [Prevotella sp.]